MNHDSQSGLDSIHTSTCGKQHNQIHSAPHINNNTINGMPRHTVCICYSIPIG